ncbi:MAG: hypothetical protein NVV59_11230 [Chitinophagaceae bacterium]|nr:hypothetical protein [Chitinophagaceae bacterium]
MRRILATADGPTGGNGLGEYVDRGEKGVATGRWPQDIGIFRAGQLTGSRIVGLRRNHRRERVANSTRVSPYSPATVRVSASCALLPTRLQKATITVLGGAAATRISCSQVIGRSNLQTEPEERVSISRPSSTMRRPSRTRE